MLAMVVNDDTGHQAPRGVLGFIASMLAPTVDWSAGRHQIKPCRALRCWSRPRNPWRRLIASRWLIGRWGHAA